MYGDLGAVSTRIPANLANGASGIGSVNPMLEHPVTTARNRIQAFREGVQSQTSTLRQIADVNFGGEPAGQSGPTNKPVRSGEMGLLHDDLDDLEEALTVMAYQIERFRSLGVVPPPQPPRLAR